MTRIGYARVSTPDQQAGLAAQVSMLEADGCEFVFRDIASGKLASRPQWDAAMAILKPGDVLVAVRLDRFSRSVQHLLGVAEDFGKRGLDLVCTDQPIDTTTAAGKLFFTILAAFAEFERNLISERTIDGLKATAGRGRNGGRKPKLKPHDVAYARAQADAHRPITELARELGVSRATLYRALDTTAQQPARAESRP
jgi:DNA invertase Pin-like site-specific DNA recombinase